MRLKITLDTDKIPVQYQFLFVSYIKDALRKAAPSRMKMFEETHQLKPYTFSVFMNDFEMIDDEFVINQDVSWFISSNDTSFIISLYNGLRNQRKLVYQGYEGKIRNIQLIKEKKVKHSMVLGRFMSPIVIRNKEGIPVNPYDQNFEKEFHYIVNLTLKEMLGRGMSEPITFEPVNMKKVVRKIPPSKTDRPVYIEAWKGDFALGGNKEDLQALYELGVGFRRSQGYGMFDLI